MKKALQYLKNRKTKPDAKLCEKDTDTAIKCEEHYILVFEYVGKISMDFTTISTNTEMFKKRLL